MGQQMQREENEYTYRGEGEHSYQAQSSRDENYAYTPQLSRSDLEERPHPYRDSGQKVGGDHQADARQSLSAGQRLALAIVSVSILVPIIAILIEGSVSNDNAGNFLIISSRLFALLLVCVTIMVVNLASNRRR